MSLKALARERLAILRAGETEVEPCFTIDLLGLMPVKHEEPQKTAENRECFTVSPPKARNGETRLKQAQIDEGLRRLMAMSPPNVKSLDAWAQARADALRLRAEGWVEKALELGWEPLHLFGCSPTLGGNGDHEGLAIQLAGRAIMLMDERSAVLRTEVRSYSVFNVRKMTGAALLWDFQDKQP